MTIDNHSKNAPLDIPAYALLWAKSEKDSVPDIHLLIYHLIDVGECALALWKYALREQSKRHYARILGLNLEQSGNQLAMWAALHDLGKAAPGFQGKYQPAKTLLESHGFSFPPQSPKPAPHGILTTWSLMDLLVSESEMTRGDARKIAVVLGGHHGAWPTNDRFSPLSLKSSDKGDETWHQTRRDIFRIIRDSYKGVSGIHLHGGQIEINAFLALFSGMVSVADWIGSISESFQFNNTYMDVGTYRNQAARTAKNTLKKLGWLGWMASGQQKSFSALFPAIRRPNDIQEKAFQSVTDISVPALVILEAPTGTGKTETALFLADTWLQSERGQGIYIAMPTQATSNQMFERFVDFLVTRYPQQEVNAHLVHSAALLSREGSSEVKGIAQDELPVEGRVKAETWFLPRKRTLLAPFGVGTVDQAFLSVLKTNHFFVRMHGLSHKVVIFDEVHAYDTYMSTLLERLLAWLKSIESSVIILSATLPEQTRQALLDAWLGEKCPIPERIPYPRITTAYGGKVESVMLPNLASRKIRITWVDESSTSLADLLEEKLSTGGCAAVICNRVQRAQEVYADLKQRRLCAPEDLILFHARYPFHWRDETERKVLAKFGKGQAADGQPNPNRPHKAIVVATQVIEQSLDLDFDFLVTDLAPLDLIIQRVGRLQRHSHNDAHRPARLREAAIAIVRPGINDRLPDFGLDSWVYDRAVLLRSWWNLLGKEFLLLPDDTSELIEAVYGELDPCEEMPSEIRSAIEKAMLELGLQNDKEIFEAKKRMIAAPMDEGLLSDVNEGLEEEHPGIHQAFRALTRMAEPGVAIICLHQCEQGISLDPDGETGTIDLQVKPNIQQIRELLRRMVNIQNREVVKFFTYHEKTPEIWREIAALRYNYPVIFDRNGYYRPAGAGFVLKLDRELGLIITKEEK